MEGRAAAHHIVIVVGGFEQNATHSVTDTRGFTDALGERYRDGVAAAASYR